MLLRLVYLGITNAFALLRLLPGGGRDKDIEILSLLHQLTVLQRQLAGQRVRLEPVERVWLVGLLHPLPRPTLRGLRLLVRPDTILKWHRDLIARRHAAQSRPRRRGRPSHAAFHPGAGVAPGWGKRQLGCRRVHANYSPSPITVAASTVWEIMREAGIDPAPDRAATTWTDFLRSHAEALLAVDFIETVTLTGARMYILAAIEHASRRIRVLGVTAHPTAAWVGQVARNLVMDLDDAGGKVKYLIRDGKYPSVFDPILADAGIKVVLSGIQVPRTNSITECWVRTCRREIPDPGKRRPQALSSVALPPPAAQ